MASQRKRDAAFVNLIDDSDSELAKRRKREAKFGCSAAKQCDEPMEINVDCTELERRRTREARFNCSSVSQVASSPDAAFTDHSRGASEDAEAKWRTARPRRWVPNDPRGVRAHSSQFTGVTAAEEGTWKDATRWHNHCVASVNEYKNSSKERKQIWHDFCLALPWDAWHGCTDRCQPHLCLCRARDPARFSCKVLEQFLDQEGVVSSETQSLNNTEQSGHDECETWWGSEAYDDYVPNCWFGNDCIRKNCIFKHPDRADNWSTPAGGAVKRTFPPPRTRGAARIAGSAMLVHGRIASSSIQTERTASSRHGSDAVGSMESRASGSNDVDQNRTAVAVWEFLKDGWVEFSEDACAHVEAAWAQWQDNSNPQDGGGQILIEIGAYPYEVDFANLTQRNLRTGKERTVRRREISGSLSSCQHQQLAQERLALKLKLEQCEQELEAGRAREADLKSKLAALQQQMSRKDAVSEQLQSEKLELSRQSQEVGEWWKTLTTNRAKSGYWATRPHQVEPMQTLLSHLLIPAGHALYNDCARACHVSVESVQEVINPALWKKFCLHREQASQRLQDQQHYVKIAAIAPQTDVLREHLGFQLDASANEAILMHGTSGQDAEKIAKSGFDPRLAGKGLYGNGVYFTTDSCKATRYSKEADQAGCCCLVVARVILGNPFLATGPMRAHKRPPSVDGTDVSHDSIIARPGISLGDWGRKTQVHWEFVVSEAGAAYPELIVRFRKGA